MVGNLTEFVNGTNLTEATSGVVTVETSNWISSFFLHSLPAIASRFWDLVSAPFYHPHMQWIIIPLILTFLATEFYFFRHTDEELSWNAALVNSMVLIFIAIDLTKTAFHEKPPLQVAQLFAASLTSGESIGMFLVIIFIGGLGLALATINYFHLLPRRLAFILSSHPPINFIAYFAIVIVYSHIDGNPIPLDKHTVIAGTLLFTLIVLVLYIAARAFGSKDLGKHQRVA